MKNRLSILSFVFLCLVQNQMVFGQQDAQFTQYLDNTLFINPAYAGSNDVMNITSMHREQWVGFAGRPTSTTFSIHSPLKYRSIGTGLTVVNDVVGPIQQTMFYGDFSYSLKFKNINGELAFGLKGGVNLINSREDLLKTTDDKDPNFLANNKNHINPNFGLGVYYHSKYWFAGISSPKILEGFYNGTGQGRENRHYFLIAGGIVTLNKEWKLRPSTQLKYTAGAPVSADLGVAGVFNDKFWIGLTSRITDSFGAYAQYQVTPQFKAGVAYDYTISELTKYNKGTYEVMLSYDFLFSKKGIRSPRYF